VLRHTATQTHTQSKPTTTQKERQREREKGRKRNRDYNGKERVDEEEIDKRNMEIIKRQRCRKMIERNKRKQKEIYSSIQSRESRKIYEKRKTKHRHRQNRANGREQSI